MTRQPTLRQLALLVSLHTHQHFGKAARASFVSQSTFSLAIKELESQLGATLVDRTSRKVLFTSFGKEVVEQARVVLHETDRLIEIASRGKEPFTGRLRLGVIPTIAPFVLPAILPDVRRRWPKLELSIREDLTRRLHDELLEGQLDLILIALPFDLKGTDTLTLFKDRFLLAYRKGTALFDPDHYEEETLPDGSILLLEDGHCLRNQALSACSVKHIEKISPYSASSLYTLVQMVDNDLGITFVPELAHSTGLLARTNVETMEMPRGAYREIGFAWLKGTVRADEYRTFSELFRKLGAEGG